MDSFSDEQFQRLLEGLGQANDIEPFECFLGNLEDVPDIPQFNSYCDPAVIPVTSDNLLSFPPLPPIEEETTCSNMSPIPTLTESSSTHSIPTSAPEINEALETAHWAKFLVESVRSQQQAMALE